MRIFEKLGRIDFMGKRKLAVIFSLVLIIVSIGSLATRGLNFGIDFTGGILIELGYSAPADLPEVRRTLGQNGFSDAIVQHFGTSRDVLVRLAPRPEESNAAISDNVIRVLSAATQDEVELKRVEFVGPQVGDDLAEDGGLAILFALIGILIYVALRFEYRFALGSVLALVHDVIITMGAFSVTGVEFDLTVLAAILAVIGYSLNDTIVVFDRVRDNFRKLRKESIPAEVFNTSLNETLSRTTMTSFTTLLVVIALFYFGGELIHGFSMALMVGIVIGTYSSIYVASPLTLMLGVSREDLMPPQKEGAGEEGDMP